MSNAPQNEVAMGTAYPAWALRVSYGSNEKVRNQASRFRLLLVLGIGLLFPPICQMLLCVSFVLAYWSFALRVDHTAFCCDGGTKFGQSGAISTLDVNKTSKRMFLRLPFFKACIFPVRYDLSSIIWTPLFFCSIAVSWCVTAAYARIHLVVGLLIRRQPCRRWPLAFNSHQLVSVSVPLTMFWALTLIWAMDWNSTTNVIWFLSLCYGLPCFS